jgi:hypothetical protein
MGIRFLNKFLMSNCSKHSIRKTHLSEFSNKVFVIDASIYLYKYVGMEALAENIYLLVTTLLSYNIIPIFVFDGKPPKEKKELIAQRTQRKKEAESKYNEIKEQFNTQLIGATENMIVADAEEMREMREQMDVLKKQFVRIRENDIEYTKKLLTALGVKYYDASGEADDMCVKMVIKKKAWACMSDDMDMFLYGCKRVIRNISLMNHTCYYYNMDGILYDLGMSMNIFRQIMVLSGTDYNIDSQTSLYETVQWYYEYRNAMFKKGMRHLEYDGPLDTPFFEWLYKNTKYIQDKDRLITAYNMFLLKNFETVKDIPYTNIKEVFHYYTKRMKGMDDGLLREMLGNEGFIFV